MTIRALFSAGLLALASAVPAVAADPISVDLMPPVVVKTSPQAGVTGVDPTLGEIRVTFSKTMQTREMWSFVKASADSFPEVAGQPHYLSDERTIVLPVRLEPGRTYAMWINSAQHDAFRDRGHNPAVPYLLVFQTRR